MVRIKAAEDEMEKRPQEEMKKTKATEKWKMNRFGEEKIHWNVKVGDLELEASNSEEKLKSAIHRSCKMALSKDFIDLKSKKCIKF